MAFKKAHNQTLTYWGNPSPDGVGWFTFDSPASITGRWEDLQILFIDAQGQEQTSRSVVYLGQDVDVEGFLYLGTSTESDPKDQSGAFRIRQFGKIPNIKGTEYERVAYL